MTHTLDDARDRDAADPLAAFRDEFVAAPGVVAYFDGNSLGRLPVRTRDRLRVVAERQWGERLIRGWDEGWVELPVLAGDELGAVLGAAPGQVVVDGSTSTGLHKLLHVAAGLRPDRDEVVVADTDFPTDRYLVEGVARERGLTVRTISPDVVENVTAAELAQVLGPRTAVVLLGQVDYRSATVLDVAALTRQAHDAGAVVIWDLCHSAGVLPADLDAADVDLAVGCSYKYLNGGPGAPAWTYVATRHLASARQPVPGWWSADDLFAMADEYVPAPDVRRMLSGTPNVLGIEAVRSGASLTAEAGIEAVAAKARALTSFAVDLVDAWLPQAGLRSLRDPARRGGHVSIALPGAQDVTRRAHAAGVLPDFRHPDVVRLGLSPLSTSYEEVWQGLRVIADLAT